MLYQLSYTRKVSLIIEGRVGGVKMGTGVFAWGRRVVGCEDVPMLWCT